MDLCLLLKILVKILVRIISKNVSGKYSQNLLDHAKQSARDPFKTCKRGIQQEKQLVISLVKKLLTGLQKFQKIPNKIIQRHL